MRRREYLGAVLATAMVVAAAPAHAQTTAAAKAALDPGAMAALQGMGAYLRTLKTFQVEAVTTNEDVLEDGQKTQYDGTVTILAQMPGRLRAEVSNERDERMYLYDGKSFTLFAKRLNYYATVPAPATIGQLADKLDENYGIGVPLSDLFRWGTPGWSTEGITAATGPRPQRRPGHDLPALRLPPGRHRLADLDPEGREPAAAQARDHHEDRRGAAAAHGRLHLEPRALVQRRRVHVRPAGRRRQGRARRDQGRRRGDQVGDRHEPNQPNLSSPSPLAAAVAAAPAQADKVRSSGRDNVNSNKNVNVNRNSNKNVNVNRNVDRDVDIDVDVDHHHRGGYYGGGCCYHDDHNPIATAAAVTAAAVVTSAVVGSIVNSPPSGCVTTIVNGFAYQQCGNTWYQPQISGGNTTYIVVNPPR